MSGTPESPHHPATAGGGSVPVWLTRLVGREAALAELRQMVWHNRLLSLCGPGGIGKTRLAAALAEALKPDLIGGVAWADLSFTTDPAQVRQRVAASLVQDPRAPESIEAVLDLLREPRLLVIDNCEQVVQACAELCVSLLSQAPRLRILTTTRRPLGVPGEQVWRVPGLALERAQAPGGAAEMFLERALQGGAVIDPRDHGALEGAQAICRALDGLPLAIELAAARTASLGMEEIRRRLALGQTELLQQPRRPGLERHRGLRQTLRWSYELLAERERTLFRRLGCFRGGFSLAACEEICGLAPLSGEDLVCALDQLVDDSLVHVIGPGREPRYRLLEVLRSFALDELRRSGEVEVLEERHADHFLALALDVGGGPDGDPAQRLGLDAQNIEQALDLLLDRRPADAAALAGAAWPHWYRSGHYEIARRRFEQVLERSARLPPGTRLRVLVDAAEVAFMQCDYGESLSLLERAIALARELGERFAEARVLQRLGTIAREQGRYDDAWKLHDESMSIWRELGEDAGVCSAHNYLGFVAWLSGRPELGESHCRSALECLRRGGPMQDTALALINLGSCILYGGDATAACEPLEEALSISRSLGFQEGCAWALNQLAVAGRRRRRPDRELAEQLAGALRVHRRLRDRWRMASVIEELAGTIVVRRDPRLAASLLSACERLREQLGTPVPPAEAADLRATLARVRRILGTRDAAAAFADGRALSFEEASALALAAVEGLAAPEAPEAQDRGPVGLRQGRALPALTRRERAVVELLAEGHTNAEIAAALFISSSTAGVHVSNILRKLGAKRRVDAAAIAQQLGLLGTPVS